jgi:ABC-2 type transport system permease protein
MTATTYPSSPVPSVRATATRRAVKAEWTKLRTLPSTWRTVAMTVVAAIGFSALATAVQASSWATMSAQQRQAFDPTSSSLTGMWVAVVILGALGVRSVAAEYSTGMIRATFTAMPGRRRVLAAKAATAAAFVFPLALLCDVVSFELGQRILAGKHIQVALSHPGTLQALIFGAVAASLVTIVGVGLAGVIRHTAGAVTALAMLILGGAIFGQMLPAGLRQYIPGIAVQAAVTVHRSAGLLRPSTALLVLVVYAIVALGAAALRVAHRDV